MPHAISQILKTEAEKSLEYHFELASKSKYLKAYSDRIKQPTLCFNQRGKVAGSALLLKNVIRLNSQLFEYNQTYYLNQVIPHELAHLLVAQICKFRVKPHGTHWQNIMTKVFDLPPDVTHKLDTSVLGLNTFRYNCSCQTFQLSKIRHNKVINNKQSYKCVRCGVTLKPEIEGLL